ncbi:hypothetical protein V9L05_10890 [Bernardetia sp. Wsw4-3y2]|uniref:hypothetical protein n=1 Tax=Bernardetia sp. Wsw4-3y2 TaxID=3127471 RepID=UPI0030D33C61
MNLETLLKNYAAKIIGFSMAICNLFFLINIIHLFYQYHFNDHFVCFIIRLSNAVLLTLSILFSSGIGIGILIFKEKINYLKWSLINIGIVTSAFVIANLSTM